LEFNINAWGVKWDVSHSSEADVSPDGRFAVIRFNTPWSVPTAAFEAIINQHPELEFEFKCIEEQGWGIEYSASDPDDDNLRSLIVNDEWDIPASHNEWLKRDGECNACAWGDDDEENRYKDCPPVEAEDE
jgi:hypothetical protein